jgi:hypothetical protein
MTWGKQNENGVWLSRRWQFRFLGPVQSDRLFYLALGPLRVRIMGYRA